MEKQFLPAATEIKGWLNSMKDMVELEESKKSLTKDKLYSLGHSYIFAKTALEKGECVNSQNMKNGKTPMHFAVEAYNEDSAWRIIDVMKLFLANGADLMIKDCNGITALDLIKQRNINLD